MERVVCKESSKDIFFSENLDYRLKLREMIKN